MAQNASHFITVKARLPEFVINSLASIYLFKQEKRKGLQ